MTAWCDFKGFIMNSHIPRQIGCGYCIHEKECTKRDPKINKAKLGCEEWEHWQAEDYKKTPTMEKEYAEQIINKMLADKLSYAEMVKVISIIDARLNRVRKVTKVDK